MSTSIIFTTHSLTNFECFHFCENEHVSPREPVLLCLEHRSGGYRDITVNVVYRSTLRSKLKMICEIHFVLNQYRFEKEKGHKLQCISDEAIYFQSVIREISENQNQRKKFVSKSSPSVMVEEESEYKEQSPPNVVVEEMDSSKGTVSTTANSRHLTAKKLPLTPRRMVFEQVLSLRDDVDLPENVENDNMYFKSSINRKLGWLAVNCGATRTPNKILIVDLADNSVLFEHRAYGRYCVRK